MAKPTAKPTAPLSATVITERAANGSDSYGIAFDLVSDLKVDIPGPFGPEPIDETASDLLDIALSVYFLERDERRKAETNRVFRIEAMFPVRQPAFWTPLAPHVRDLLRFMGGHDWDVRFTQSTAELRKADETSERKAAHVVLNSGGMDSTCGLSTLTGRAAKIRPASVYTVNSKIQREIATELGFEEPAQMRAVWRNRNERRGNGGLAYRSFLFLTFGAVVARTYGARTLLQFENGVLARGIAPAASYFTTRHAHPKTHRLFTELTAAAGLPLTVENPLVASTKGEAVAECRRALTRKRADLLLARTDSCWYFHYLRVPVRFGSGTIPKRPRRHCGICMPCLVRRAAFRDDEYELDPRRPPRMGIDARSFTYNYNAMRSFCDLVAKPPDGAALRRTLARNGIDVDPESGSWDDLQSLLGRFAVEFKRAFS